MTDGTIDWELIFENEDTGLIPLINRTRTQDGLRQCVSVVIRSVFHGAEDAESRAKFESMMNDLIPPPEAGLEDDEAAIQEEKAKLIELLREIKDNRLAAESGDAAEVAPAAPVDAAEAFTEIFSAFIAKRFQALQTDIEQAENKAGKLPFMLSAAFAERFDGLLRRHVLPNLVGRCRGLLTRAEQLPADEARASLEKSFEDRKDSAALAEAWKEAWEEATGQQELPPKPEEKKTGLLDRFKKSEGPAWKPRQLTPEEWKAKVKEIKQANKTRAAAWSEFCVADDAYLAPRDDDREFLGNLFVKTPAGLAKQITALRQIAEQGGEEDANVGKMFDSYSQGKNTDLALLAVTFRLPKLMLGEEKFLKVMLKGYDDRRKRSDFPYVLRYLSDHL